MKKTTPIIYIVDDDPDDRYFIGQALRATDPSVVLIEADNGDHLLTLLESRTQASTPQPVHLILLDMNMPKLNGLETLLALKANPLFQHIPTVLLSTSAHPDQVATAYRNGINSYIQKPVSWLELNPIAQALSICFLSASTTQLIKQSPDYRSNPHKNS